MGLFKQPFTKEKAYKYIGGTDNYPINVDPRISKTIAGGVILKMYGDFTVNKDCTVRIGTLAYGTFGNTTNNTYATVNGVNIQIGTFVGNSTMARYVTTDIALKKGDTFYISARNGAGGDDRITLVTLRIGFSIALSDQIIPDTNIITYKAV